MAQTGHRAAGIAVGFLLWHGSPAGASELVKDPLASAAKNENTAGMAALGAVAGKAVSHDFGGVKASISVQATTYGSERSGHSAAAAVNARITSGDSKVHATVNWSEGKAKGLPTCELACKQLIEDRVRLRDVLRDAADDAATGVSDKLGEASCELEPGDVARNRATKHTRTGAAVVEKCLHGTVDCDRLKHAWRHRC